MKHLFKSEHGSTKTMFPFAIVESIQINRHSADVFTRNTPIGHDDDLQPIRLELTEVDRFVSEWESYLETYNQKNGAQK